jgi:3-deoxy-D-manno-octulosonic-acid transferase
VALGVPDDRVCVTGDLKLASKRAGVGLPGDLARALSGAPVVVAGSTHAGEERAALSALDRCEGEGVDAALVLAPRQLSRVDQVLEEVREAGRAAIRRSALDGAVLESGQVLILDSLGELAGVYAAAAAAFVGGTLAPVGGHNLFEPMSVGCPVVFGPYIQNIRSAAELAIQSRAGLEVADSRALAAALCDLLRDPSERRARGAAGRAALERQRDTPLRNAEVIFRTLGRKRGPAAPAAPVSVCSSDEATR